MGEELREPAALVRPLRAGPFAVGPLGVSAAIAGLCLILSLCVVALLSLAVGASPAAVLGALASGALGSQQALTSTLREMTPIALTGMAFLLPFRAGFFNIGAQGQLELGALAAIATATTLEASPALVMTAAVLLAAVAGAAALLLSFSLKIARGASEVTTTIMLNFAVLEFTLAMVTGPMKDPAAFFGTTLTAPHAFRLPAVPAHTGLHLGIWLGLLLCLAVDWIARRTVFGFHLRAVGGNEAAARAAGIPVRRVMAVAVLLAGGLAGVAGAIQALGVVYRVAEGWSKPWGFVGILAALLGGSPVGVLPAALLLAVLESGARHMQAMTGVPSALVYVLQALPVLLFLTLRSLPAVRRLTAPPTAGSLPPAPPRLGRDSPTPDRS
ncbi:MAG: ABC transporter permease [Armatimonadota bacterium]|nr:ABC transporter permease [Armatimonadota bacterium]MDR7548640.1 ABC transporter permease [Armatimonadota bacterium]